MAGGGRVVMAGMLVMSALLLAAIAPAAAQCPACFPAKQKIQIKLARRMINNDVVSLSFLMHNQAVVSSPPPYNTLTYTTYNTETFTIQNTASTPQIIDGMFLDLKKFSIQRPKLTYTMKPGETLPITVSLGGSIDCPKPRQDCTRGVYSGTLRIRTRDSSDNSRNADNIIQLRGIFQYSGEISRGKYSEPTVYQIGYALGLGTDFGKNAQKNDIGAPFNNFASTTTLTGDEIYARYFTPADATKNVGVYEIASWRHMDGPATLFQAPYPTQCDGITSYQDYFGCVHSSVAVNSPKFFDPAVNSVQTIYPKLQDGGDAKFEGLLPAGKGFGFAIGLSLFMDSLASNAMPQCLAVMGNNPALCGHNARVFPTKSRQGKVVPNSYLVIVDNFAGNYDYQDHVYMFTNVKIFK